MKFRGSRFMFYGSIIAELGIIGLIVLLNVKAGPQLMLSAFLLIIGVLPMVYVILFASVSYIIDEDGVCKTLFSRRFSKMEWDEIVETGVQYPYGINNYMVQAYFSKKVIRETGPNKLLYERDKKCFIAFPYTKELERHVLYLAESNPSIRDKFNGFPVTKDSFKQSSLISRHP